MLEAGETVVVEPAWHNSTSTTLAFTGAASNIAGPPGASYAITNAGANYGSAAPGATTDCYGATPSHDCYQAMVTGPRPVPHWDATFDESLSLGGPPKSWTLHVGESFTDVPTTQQFYKFIENIFHNGITGGCGTGIYCPDSSVTRAQMAAFLLKAKHGASYTPPACTGVFSDVPCPSLFADWIEDLYIEGITGGCGAGIYCPANPVTRAQMAAFLLKASHGSVVPAARLRRDLRGRGVPEPVRGLDRGALRRGNHRRLRRGNRLPQLAEHARPDGRLPDQDVRAGALRTVRSSP